MLSLALFNIYVFSLARSKRPFVYWFNTIWSNSRRMLKDKLRIMLKFRTSSKFTSIPSWRIAPRWHLAMLPNLSLRSYCITDRWQCPLSSQMLQIDYWIRLWANRNKQITIRLRTSLWSWLRDTWSNVVSLIVSCRSQKVTNRLSLTLSRPTIWSMIYHWVI